MAHEILARITSDGEFSLVHEAACAALQEMGFGQLPEDIVFGWKLALPSTVTCSTVDSGVPRDLSLTPSLLQALTAEVDSWLYRNVASSRLVVVQSIDDPRGAGQRRP